MTWPTLITAKAVMGVWWKNKIYWAIFWTLGLIFDWNEIIIFLLLLLFFIDLLTGLWKYAKLKQISSKGFSKWLGKLASYGIFIIIGVTFDEILGTWQFWLYTMFFFTGATETISIFENLEAVGIDTPTGFKKFLNERKGNIFNKKDES